MNIRRELHIANLRNPGLARQVLEVILRNLGLTSPISAYDLDPGNSTVPTSIPDKSVSSRVGADEDAPRIGSSGASLTIFGPHNRLALPPIVFDPWVNLHFVLECRLRL